MLLTIYTELCNYYCNQFTIFHHPKKKRLPLNQSLCPLFNWIDFLLLNYKGTLYILDISHLQDT